MPLHSGLTGASLHECKGADSATTGTVRVSDGAGSGSWTTIGNAAVPVGWPVQIAANSSQTVVTTSTAIPADNTIPQNTEGAELVTCSITPRSATNKLLIIGSTFASPTNDGSLISLALFQDSTANGLAATAALISEDWVVPLTLVHYMTAGTTSSTTFKLRGGPNSGTDSVSFLSQAGSSTRMFGGVASHSIVIYEFKAS